MKLDPAGNLLWATYLGGSQDDAGTGIAVDGSGSVYVSGETFSPDFRVTPGAWVSQGSASSFVVKLSPEGQLVYSSSFIESGRATALAVDGAGQAYVTGIAIQIIPDGFVGSFADTTHVCKLNVSGSQLLYCSTFDRTRGSTIAIDAEGSAYLGTDTALFKLNALGSIVYARELRGTPRALALDTQHTLYIAGSTTDPSFQATPGAFQERFNFFDLSILGALSVYSNEHGFVTRLSADSGEVLAATLLEGENWDRVLALKVDSAGTVTAAGVTSSNSFPLREAFQMRFGYQAGFVAQLTSDLSTLLFSTYVGDTRNFAVSGLVIADDRTIFLAGDMANANTAFSRTDTVDAGSDVFVNSLDVIPSTPLAIEGVNNTASQVGTRIAPGESITVMVTGVGADTVLLLDHQPLPTLARTGERLVAQVPADYPVTGTSTVQVQSDELLSAPLLVASGKVAPAIYTQDGSGHGQALALHEDGTLITPDHPATSGEIIAIACNGVGRVTFDGDYAVAETPVSVYVDGIYANGVDAHVVQQPGIPGNTYVIRVRVPDLPINSSGESQFVGLTLNLGGSGNRSGELSQPDVGISWKR